MKAIGFLTFLPLMAAMPMVYAKSELEILRTRCVEQERQIRQLEEENHRLKGDQTPAAAPSFSSGGTRLISTAPEKPAPAKASAPSEAKGENTNGTYVVRKGDSLERIARKLHTSTKTLSKLNGITTETMLHPGQSLKVPSSANAATKQKPDPSPTGQTQPSESTSSGATKPKSTPSSSGAETYNVRQGDTFYSIARKYHTTPEALQKINPTVKANAVRPGLVLRLKTPAEKPKTHTEDSQKTEATNKPENKPVAKPEPKPVTKQESKQVAKQEPKPVTKPEPKPEPKPVVKQEPKSELKNTVKSDTGNKGAMAFQPVEKHNETAAKEIPPASFKPAAPITSSASPEPAPFNPASIPKSLPETPKKTGIHPVPVTEKITFGDFATKHGTTTAKLNELNGLSLSGSTILAEGSELYIPAQP